MIRLISAAFCISIMLSACSNADPKKMAAELCNCIKADKPLSAQAKKIILKATRSDDFQESIQTQMMAIEDAEQKEAIEKEIQKTFQTFQGTKIQECAKNIDQKYRVYKTQEKDIQQKLMDEMEAISDCEVYAAVVKLGMKQQNNHSNTESNNNTVNDSLTTNKNDQ